MLTYLDVNVTISVVNFEMIQKKSKYYQLLNSDGKYIVVYYIILYIFYV